MSDAFLEMAARWREEDRARMDRGARALEGLAGIRAYLIAWRGRPTEMRDAEELRRELIAMIEEVI